MAKPMTKTEWMNWLEKAWDEAQQREWVGLTDEEVSEIIRKEIGFNSCFGPEESFARAIEAKLKEKNTCYTTPQPQEFVLTQTNVGIGERGMQAYEEAKKRGWVGISDE